jgi:mannose-6-phosphate isomerase-like protein (cupin superfamily)
MALHLPAVHERLLTMNEGAATLQELRAQVETRFAEMPSVSVDVGILERSERVVTIPAHFGWTDIGDWAAMGRLLPADDDGNAVRGEALLRDSHGLIVDADASRLVVTIGVNDLIIVDTPQALLLCAKEKVQEVRQVTGLATAFVEALTQQQRPEGREVLTPWGREIWWAMTDRYAGRLLEVRAGHALSLHLHERKHETLFVQRGTGRLRRGEEWHWVRPGAVFAIPPGTPHRIEAHADLAMIEVSTPEVDDVVHLEEQDSGAVRP